MNRFISIHPDRCIGCGTCRAACSEGHIARGLQSEPRLSLVQTKGISAAVTCHHCEGAPCLEVCPVAAITREDGMVHVNEQHCVGCKLCAVVCTFGAIHPAGTSIAGVAGTSVNTPTYPKRLDPILRYDIGVYTCAVKCDLCAGDPRCVAACPTAALEYVREEGIAGSIKDRRLEAALAAGDVQESIAEIRRSR